LSFISRGRLTALLLFAFAGCLPGPSAPEPEPWNVPTGVYAYRFVGPGYVTSGQFTVTHADADSLVGRWDVAMYEPYSLTHSVWVPADSAGPAGFLLNSYPATLRYQHHHRLFVAGGRLQCWGEARWLEAFLVNETFMDLRQRSLAALCELRPVGGP
jgi:hypothetical protein